MATVGIAKLKLSGPRCSGVYLPAYTYMLTCFALLLCGAVCCDIFLSNFHIIHIHVRSAVLPVHYYDRFCSWQPPGALFWTFSCHVSVPLIWNIFGPFLDHFGPILVLHFDPLGIQF